MEYIPDPIERGEARCEDWAAEHVHGNMATCCCGKEFRLVDGETTSADPYAIPVCPDCFDEWFQRQLGKGEGGKLSPEEEDEYERLYEKHKNRRFDGLTGRFIDDSESTQ